MEGEEGKETTKKYDPGDFNKFEFTLTSYNEILSRFSPGLKLGFCYPRYYSTYSEFKLEQLNDPGSSALVGIFDSNGKKLATLMNTVVTESNAVQFFIYYCAANVQDFILNPFINWDYYSEDFCRKQKEYPVSVSIYPRPTDKRKLEFDEMMIPTRQTIEIVLRAIALVSDKSRRRGCDNCGFGSRCTNSCQCKYDVDYCNEEGPYSVYDPEQWINSLISLQHDEDEKVTEVAFYVAMEEISWGYLHRVVIAIQYQLENDEK